MNKKNILYIISFVLLCFFILVGVFTNMVVSTILLIFTLLCFCIFNNKINIDKVIFFAIFFTPCSETFKLITSFADFKILQILWSIILFLIVFQKITIKEYSFSGIGKDNLFFVLYVAILIISSIFSTNYIVSIKELIQYIYLLFIMYTIILKSKKELFLNNVINIIIKSNMFFIIVCILSYLLGKAVIPTITVFISGNIYVNFDLFKLQDLISGTGSINRIGGLFGLGPIGIANVILIQSFFINCKIRNTLGKEKIFYYLLLLGNFIVMVLTYSRAGLIIFILLHAYTLFDKNTKNNILYIILGICFIAVFLVCFPNVAERLLETFNLNEASTKYHFVFWLAAIKLGYNNLFTGIGLGMSKYSLTNFAEFFNNYGIYKVNSVDMHNIILQIWAEQGLFGLIISLLILLGPIIYYLRLKYVKRVIQGKSVYYFIMLAYTATFLFNLTNNNFYIESFWIILALVYSGKYSAFQTIDNDVFIKQGNTIQEKI